MSEQIEHLPQCEAMIYKRDTYRRSGRGKGGFEMHYSKEQCSRRAVERGLCRVHSRTPNILRVPWLSPPSQWVKREAE